jgi:hypothetical protein
MTRRIALASCVKQKRASAAPTRDLDRFYSLLAALGTLPGQGQPLSQQTGRSPWPQRGVYFFREPGEHRSGRPEVARVVRVGTHAVSAGSRSTLWGRLRAHRGGADGGGNHRGSIFRLHVGAALLAREGLRLPTWSVGSSAAKSVRATEVDHERRVSTYIGSMTALWVAVSDEPGPASARSHIERNAIALLSNHREPLDPPSAAWLGRYSPREDIRESGLWNLNYLDLDYEASFLDVLEESVERTRQLAAR